MQNMEIRAEIATRRSIGERIRKARVARGWTQAQLALRSGLREALICKYERGYYMPKSDILLKLASALEVSTDYLLGKEASRDA